MIEKLTLQELLDLEASLANRRSEVIRLIERRRDPKLQPICYGNDDCGTHLLSMCPWRMDCDNPKGGTYMKEKKKMNTYNPDRWVILKVVGEAGVFYKVLGSWYGGYLGGDSWQLSSGIVDVIEYEKMWELPQDSGSVYLCNKEAYGMSSYTCGVLAGWQKALDNSCTATMEVMDENFDIALVKPK